MSAQATIESETKHQADGTHAIRSSDLLHPVAVLCCAKNSVYKTLSNVECYDAARDVRTFAGGMKIVAHPPCRTWSAYCAHQAKPEPGEKELGPLCVDWLRKCGGVLEHPAHSRLFDACKLPKPGWTVGWKKGEMPIWSMEVLQGWWGDTRSKKTWLCFFGIHPTDFRVPYRFVDAVGDRRRWQLMSKTQRSATHPAMAEWLVQTARAAKGCNEKADLPPTVAGGPRSGTEGAIGG
jgi:hypothetical protein